jgi:hypothetical protein
LPNPLRRLTSSQSYWQTSRTHRYSLVFALPLLLLYEALAALLSHDPRGEIRNGADVLLRQAFYAVAGPRGGVLFGVCLIGGSLWLVGRDVRKSGLPSRGSVFAGMAAEAATLAVGFGFVVSAVTARVLGLLAAGAGGGVGAMPWSTRLMVSLGAGLYEELLFRVILVAAIGQLCRRLLGFGPWASGLVAVLAGATIFSAFHYVGPYGDPFELRSFVFRLVAGIFFSALYLLRGFGITAWTHALYDVYLLA